MIVSVAEPDQRLRSFIEQNRIEAPILMDRDRAAARAWGVTVLPTTFVLDENLRPRLFIERDVDWDQLVAADLRKSVAAPADHGPPSSGVLQSISHMPTSKGDNR